MYKRGFRQVSRLSKYDLNNQELDNACFTQLDAPLPPLVAHVLLIAIMPLFRFPTAKWGSRKAWKPWNSWSGFKTSYKMNWQAEPTYTWLLCSVWFLSLVFLKFLSLANCFCTSVCTCICLNEMYCSSSFAYVQNSYTPLHLASRNGRRDVVSLLLESGADPQAINKVGCWQCFQTAIHRPTLASPSILNPQSLQ